MQRRTPVIWICLLVAFAAAGCGGTNSSSSSQREETTITIGSVHPLTGPLADDGEPMEQALQMAVKDINEAGGIKSMGGAKLKVLSADSQGEPQVAQREAQRMIDEGAVAIVGPLQSATAATIARTAERAQVPFVIDAAAADSLLAQGYTYSFRIQPNSTSLGEFGARYLKDIAESQNSPVETVAYLYESSEFGTSVFEAFRDEAERQGMRVVGGISYDALNVSDLTSELTRAEAANPDVIVSTGYYNDGVLFAKAASQVKPDVKAVFGVANGAFDVDQFPEDVGDSAQHYFCSCYHYDATSRELQELRDRFREETGERMRTAPVFSYQAVQIIADALERAGSSDPRQLRGAIAETSLETDLFPFDGPIQFDETGQNVNAQPIVMQVQEGDITQVYPESFSQEEPLFPATPWDEGQQ